MHDNEVLKAIRGRRSVIRFTDRQVTEDEVAAILEAGRWAPSHVNSQPWEFVVVRDPETRRRMGEILQRVTVAWRGLATAPVSVVVAVDPGRGSRHLAEAGALAVQNMALAAHSLGLSSFWAGLHSAPEARGSVQSDLKAALEIPSGLQLVAVLPIGHPAYAATTGRRSLSEMVHRESFGTPMPELAG
jgi:nitroreductase